MKCRRSAVGSILLLILLTLGLGACANSESAQQLALATLKVTATYENEVDRKIAAEKAFYKKQLENIRVSLGGNPLETGLTEEELKEAQESGIKEEKEKKDEREKALKKTWLYAHIRVTAARDGLITAGNIVSKHTALARGLSVDYLEQGIQQDAASITEVRAKQAVLQESFVKALAPLNKQKKRLKEIRKRLTILAAGQGEGDRLALALSLAKALAEEMKVPSAGQ